MGRTPGKSAYKIGYVPQNVNVNLQFPISVMDVVLMGRLMPGIKRNRPGRDERQAAYDALKQMGIQHLARHRIGDLSGGQRQRVFIARALVSKPAVLLLDEPMAGIDAQGQNDLYCLLEQLNRHTTIIMVSHDMLALSAHVKSVACVNRSLHYHDQAELTPDMIDTMYPFSKDQRCPVELVAHGIPHRVLRTHEEK
jgi:zinc transport system ATP-binding protein